MKNKLMIILATLALLFSTLACGLSDSPAQPASGGEPASGSGAPADSSGSDSQPASNSGSGELAFAPKDKVVVTLGDSRITEDGVFVYTVGTIVNNTDSPISGQVRIEYFDKDGNSLNVSILGEEGQYDTTTFFAPIAPGATGYFDRMRDIEKLPTKPDTVRVSLEYAVMEKKAPAAKFSGASWEVKDGSLMIAGKVSNTGDLACLNPYVAGVLLNGGKAVGTITTGIDQDQLAPNTSMDFSASNVVDYLPKFDDVQFVIDCSPLTFER